MKDSSLAEIGRAELNSELVEAVTKGRIYSGGFPDFRLQSKEADVISIFDDRISIILKLLPRNREIVKVAKVLSKGADPNLTVTQDSDVLSMCHLAVRQNYISILSLLTSYRYHNFNLRYWNHELDRLFRVNINSVSKTYMTPLHMAAEQGNVDMARILLQNGAKTDVQTNLGLTPLMIAVENDHIEVAGLLLRLDIKGVGDPI